MLRFDSKNRSFNAACISDNTQIAYLSANTNEPDGGIYITLNADNLISVIENLESVKADFEDFMNEILGVTPEEE